MYSTGRFRHVGSECTELKRLRKYRAILNGDALPRYKSMRLLEVNFDKNASTENLERLHRQTQEYFIEHIDEFQRPAAHSPVAQSYLDLKIELAKRMLESCELCERRCKVNRTIGELGVCKVGKDILVASAFMHHGEEICLVPSGTIFFYGCNFKCVFCQNSDISQAWDWTNQDRHIRSSEELAKIADHLAEQGARNINYVGGDPTVHLPGILDSLQYMNSNVPLLWNSNMGLTKEAMTLIVDLFDFWLPDLKYACNDCASRYSKFSSYFEIVSRNLSMIETLGSREYIIRHLVLPGHVECCSIPILNWIKDNTPNALVNIMGQFHPSFKVLTDAHLADIDRRPTVEEIKQVTQHAQKLGLAWKSVS